ncbi:hypothetical protein DUI87_14736 [Hirundo rustica rustica]|uniref:Uncharacterized protein n=1 Tax=Hirundo rustica rustica TaxID=333673 RepID=A0A3M0K7C8_HIRRU|nr:hypothetical protein DUI87_14736 [Hirundo rustica rustica]
MIEEGLRIAAFQKEHVCERRLFSVFTKGKMQILEEHTFVNVQQQHSLQAELHESRNLSPKAYSRNPFLPLPINCNKCFA